MARHVTEAKTITSLENSYMTKKRRNTYIALEDVDFYWDKKEVEFFREKWDEGLPLTVIAAIMERPVDEVFLLGLDQGRKGHILERPGGLFGRFQEVV